MDWFVLCVKRKNEIKIAQQLESNGFEVYCPTITILKQWSDRKKKVETPLISTYIFVKIKDKDRSQVFEVPGILKYLFYLGAPAKVPNKEITTLKDFLKGSALVSNVETIQIGDNHTIASGPFKGKNGVVKEINNHRMQLVLKELGLIVTFTNITTD